MHASKKNARPLDDFGVRLNMIYVALCVECRNTLISMTRSISRHRDRGAEILVQLEENYLKMLLKFDRICTHIENALRPIFD